jgi:hypothetical protein
MPRARIRPEPWVERCSECAQRRGTRAEPVGDETPFVVSCRGDRLGEFLRL